MVDDSFLYKYGEHFPSSEVNLIHLSVICYSLSTCLIHIGIFFQNLRGIGLFVKWGLKKLRYENWKYIQLA
jgi:hypothetical protein